MKKKNLKKYIAMGLSVSLLMSSTVFETSTWADIQANLMMEVQGKSEAESGLEEDTLLDGDVGFDQVEDGDAETDSDEVGSETPETPETGDDEVDDEVDDETDPEIDADEVTPEMGDDEVDDETDPEIDADEVTPETEDGEADLEEDAIDDALENELSLMAEVSWQVCDYCVENNITQSEYHACATMVFPDEDGTDADGNDFDALTQKYKVTLRGIHYYAVDSNNDGHISMDEANKAVFTKPVEILAEFTYPNNTTETKTLIFTPQAFGSGHAEVYNGVVCELDDYIEAGTTIKVHGMQVSNLGTMGDAYVEGYPEYHYTAVGASATEYDTEDKPTNYAVTFGQYNPKAVFPSAHPTLYARVKATYASIQTGDTYEYLYNKAYYVENLLSRFNAVSLTDIEGVHIVGPVLSIGTTLRTRENLFSINEDSWSDNANRTGTIFVADYTAGNLSYIGEILPYKDDDDNISKDDAGTKLNYAYDFEADADFKPAALYTRLDNLSVYYQAESEWWGIEYTMPISTGIGFISPNNSGQASVLQNDSFINYDSLKSQIESDSDRLHELGALEADRGDDKIYVTKDYELQTYKKLDYNPDNKSHPMLQMDCSDEINAAGYVTYLNVEVGKSYIIDADTSKTIQTVNLILPPDYDYFANGGALDQTTISFEGATLYTETYNIAGSGSGGEDYQSHSLFPLALIGGEEMPTPTQGEHGEYSEIGNKVIWNFPNVVTTGNTNRLTIGVTDNIPGHILAPKAEVWNYSAEVDGVPYWRGGNINGGIIAKAIYTGVMEMHMWPYIGSRVDSVAVGGDVQKYFDGGTLTGGDFTFIVDLKAGENVDGIDTRLPLTASNNANGRVDFPEISFSKEGDYVFTIQEVIPDPEEDDIDYDKSVYELRVTIIEESGILKATQSVWKVVDRDGNAIDENDQVEEENIYIVAFTNKKVDPDDKSVYVHLQGKKTYTSSDTSVSEFEFEIDIEELSPTAGLDSPTTFPITEFASAYGTIVFPSMHFTEVGTYQFTVKEVVPEIEASPEFDNTVYDRSVYRVTIVVTEDSVSGDLIATTTYEKIVDSDGNDLATPETALSLLFENEHNIAMILMPRTGGIGVHILYSIGGMMVVFSLLYFLMKRRKKVD